VSAGTSEPLTDEEIAELRAELLYRRQVKEMNHRILMHEIETDMRGHDDNGACCIRARYDQGEPA
jgi:hypothetical protein